MAPMSVKSVIAVLCVVAAAWTSVADAAPAVSETPTWSPSPTNELSQSASHSFSLSSDPTRTYSNTSSWTVLSKTKTFRETRSASMTFSGGSNTTSRSWWGTPTESLSRTSPSASYTSYTAHYMTRSVSWSMSNEFSSTRSAVQTPTRWTMSLSRDASASDSSSATYSSDATMSDSAMVTSSFRVTPSQSVRPTPTRSKVPTRTPTPSDTPLPTPSPSADSTKSETLSSDLSRTLSPRISPSNTQTWSSTASLMPPPSVTHQLTFTSTMRMTRSISVNITASETRSRTRIPTSTPTVSRSDSTTPTLSPTATATVPLTDSRTWSDTSSQSASMTLAPTATPSNDVSATASTSLSQRTGSLTRTADVSASETATLPVTQSETFTNDDSSTQTLSRPRSRSQSMSNQASATQSRSRSVPPTPSRSTSRSFTASDSVPTIQTQTTEVSASHTQHVPPPTVTPVPSVVSLVSLFSSSSNVTVAIEVVNGTLALSRRIFFNHETADCNAKCVVDVQHGSLWVKGGTLTDCQLNRATFRVQLTPPVLALPMWSRDVDERLLKQPFTFNVSHSCFSHQPTSLHASISFDLTIIDDRIGQVLSFGSVAQGALVGMSLVVPSVSGLLAPVRANAIAQAAFCDGSPPQLFFMQNPSHTLFSSSDSATLSVPRDDAPFVTVQWWMLLGFGGMGLHVAIVLLYFIYSFSRDIQRGVERSDKPITILIAECAAFVRFPSVWSWVLCLNAQAAATSFVFSLQRLLPVQARVVTLLVPLFSLASTLVLFSLPLLTRFFSAKRLRRFVTIPTHRSWRERLFTFVLGSKLWVDDHVEDVSEPSPFVGRFGGFFVEYRSTDRYFGVVEVVVSLVVGCLAGIVSDRLLVCLIKASLLVVVLATFFVLTTVRRPFAAPLSQVLSTLTSLCCVAAAVAGLLVLAFPVNQWLFELLTHLANVVAYLSLATSVLRLLFIFVVSAMTLASSWVDRPSWKWDVFDPREYFKDEIKEPRTPAPRTDALIGDVDSSFSNSESVVAIPPKQPLIELSPLAQDRRVSKQLLHMNRKLVEDIPVCDFEGVDVEPPLPTPETTTPQCHEPVVASSVDGAFFVVPTVEPAISPMMPLNPLYGSVMPTAQSSRWFRRQVVDDWL